MKELHELHIPDDLRYTAEHEWARQEGDTVRIGITDYAQDQLGDVVYVDLPAPGAALEKGQEFGTVESVKAVSELYAPLGGEVKAVNADLAAAPERVNEDPYGGGWMVEIRPADPAQLDALLTADAYRGLLEGEGE